MDKGANMERYTKKVHLLVIILILAGISFDPALRLRSGQDGRIYSQLHRRDNYQNPKQNPTPEITVYRNTEYSSYVILPIYKQ